VLPLALTVLSLVAGPLQRARAASGSGLRVPNHPLIRADLSSGAAGRRWRGTMTVAFHNPGSAPLQTIWLRLWPNGILGCSGPLPIVADVTAGGTASPLEVDCTTLPIALDVAVPPGGTGQVGLSLAIEVPQRNDRFGWANGIAYLGSALPAVAIVDDGGPHLDPYSDLGESYYSQVGRYDVTLDVPDALATPATGTLAATSHGGGRTVRRFVANDVRDFAWAAASLKRRAATDAAGERIRVWYPPGQGAEGIASLTAAVRAMDAFGRDFGAYGYPDVDVVVSRFAAFGGMEYPTLVFANPSPSLVSHELAHQWWYGIVGDDEYAEPWLDEAFATWAARLALDRRSAVGCRLRDWPDADARVSNGMDYWDAHPGAYVPVVYEQGSCALAALAARFGLGRFLGILAGYVADHRLSFSTTARFREAIEAAAAIELPSWDVDAFWARWRIGPA
jgi:hypothetical protein